MNEKNRFENWKYPDIAKWQTYKIQLNFFKEIRYE